MNELRLWTVEVWSKESRRSPSRPSFYSTTKTVNVAAPDIFAAIGGALDELKEQWGDDYNEEHIQVLSANHKGRVNRIVE